VTIAVTFAQIADDFAMLDDMEDKYRAIIDLGRTLEPMERALKTETSRVRGCSSNVWLHGVRQPDGRLHFHSDSDAHIVRGLVAILLSLFQDRLPAEISRIDARAQLASLGLGNALSPTRTNGLYAMVERIQHYADPASALS
jgi:cysteine desulfuration protein SufE